MNMGVEKDFLETVHKANPEDCWRIIQILRKKAKFFRSEEVRFLCLGIMEELFCNGGIDRNGGENK